MKIGNWAMSGLHHQRTKSTHKASLSPRGVSAVFALYQAAGRYAIRCLRRAARLVPATGCLALAFVFSTALGAQAQDTTGPVGVFEPLPASHDGTTPFTVTIVFDEEPKRIGRQIKALLVSAPPPYTNRDHAPTITNGEKDPNDKRRYTFTVTPRVPVNFRLRVGAGYTDAAGNVGATINSEAIPYIAPTGGNNRPEANAGPDQVVDPGDTVTLDGSESSDRDGDETINYSWARTDGTQGVTAPELTGPTTAQPTFIADTLTSGDDDVVHVFTLTVTDNDDATDTDTMTVTVEAPDTNPIPIASAGVDQEVISGTLVTLDGSASGDDGRILSWAWERTGGTEGLAATVPLNNPNAIKPTFTANTLAVGGSEVIHIFTLIVTDNEGATGFDTVMVTVKAPLFAAPVANAGPDQTFDPGATVTLDGSGSTSDSRRTPLAYAWKRTGGTADSVTLTGANTAMPTFTAVAPDPLPATQFATHIFELTVTDSAGAMSTDTVTVRIVIPTAPLAPVANAGPDRTVTSAAAVRLDGSGSTVNPSRTIRSYAWRWIKPLSTPNVAPVTLTDETTAMPTFTAPVVAVGAKDITHVFELTVTDSAGRTNTDTVSITVIFPFAEPVANAGPDRKVGSGTVVTLDGSDSTVDLRRPDPSKSYAWARTGGTGVDTVTLTSADTATPGFMTETLTSGAADVTHIFTLTVTDSAGEEDTDTVTITVTLGNADPVADAGDDQPAVVSGTTVTLDGSDSRDSAGMMVASYAWERTGGTGDAASVTLTGEDTAMPTFRAEILQAGTADVTHVFTLTVTDDDDATATDTVTITVTPANVAPVAYAGGDRTVGPDTMVQLDGSGSFDVGGRITSHAWERTGGTTGGSVTLTGAMTARPTFTADTLQAGDADVTHIFTLTVTDDDGVTDTDTVTITVTVGESDGDTVPPTGRFEAEDGGPVPYSYSSETAFKLALVFDEAVTVSGNDVTAAISDETPISDSLPFKSRTPTITNFGQEGLDKRRYVFTVTPRDTGVPSFRITLRGRNYQDSAGNRGVVDIATAPILYVDPTVTNTAPVADAGDPQTVDSGMTNVQLDGTGSSDTEGMIRTWAWERTGGTTGGLVTLSDKTAAQPTFTADTLTPGSADVTHEFTLTVTDMSQHEIREQTRQTDPDTGDITIIETTVNPVPSACRDGRASDEQCTLAYRNSAEDTVVVTVDAPPLANAGLDMTYGSAALVTLDGSGSKDSNTGLTHAWEWTSGTGGATAPDLSDKTAASPTFTADTVAPGAADVTHTFTLTVMDSRSQSTTDTVTVTVSNPNADPVANAGADREVVTGTVVTLNGSGSSDSDGDDTITTYSWARTDGTQGVAAPTLTRATTARPGFTADTVAPGDADVIHIFTLTVTDNAGAMDTDTVTITVVAEDTTRPLGRFVSPASHDGATSFTVELIFNEDVTFSKDDLQALLVGVPIQNQGSNPRFRYDFDTHVPKISGFAQDPNNELRYTFSVTPKVPLSLRIALRGRNYEDQSGNTGTNISITIPFSGPSNKRPVAEAGDGLTVVSGTEVTLDGSDSMDDDGTVQYYAWVRTGGTGDPLALTGADTDMLTFTPRLSGGADDVTHIFTLWVSDNDLAVSEADTVTVMVTAPTAPNVVPVADAGDDRTVQSGAPVTLDGGESSDGDGTIKSSAWTRTGGTGSASLALTDANTATPDFTADTLAPGAADVTHIFSLVVTDDVGVASAADTVTITVNAPPLANAGADATVTAGEKIALDGNGSSDTGVGTLDYAWTRPEGAAGTLTDANTATPDFTAETLAVGAADVTHTFTLTVTDNEGATDTDTVTITVDAPNAPPVPNAGLDQTVVSGATVTLDGRGSRDPDGTIKEYSWRANGFDLPTLSATDTAIVTFTAPDVASGAPDQMISYALFVTDNEDLGSGSGDQVTITVTPPSSNVIPVANAGTDQTVVSGATVTLEGSGTDNGGTIQDYYWVQSSTGTAPALSANNVAAPTLTAPVVNVGDPDVTFSYALRVRDNAGALSDADEVTITVEAPRVANAGMDQTVAAGATVTLDGSRSSGTIAEYQWSRESGTSTRPDVFPGASGTLTREVSRTTPTITFVADNVPANGTSVTHVFALRVFGASRISSPKDEVTVTVSPNRLPTANAGPDQSVAAGMKVDLDGSGSIDNDGTIASYNWTRTEGDATATLTGANTATPSFTAEVLDAGAADATHTFTLTVTDNNGETDTDTVTITVKAPLAALVAEAGDPQTVDSGATVTLEGTGTATDSSRTVSYAWTWAQTGGDAATVTLSDMTMLRPTFDAPTLTAGADDATYIFTLTVTDNKGSPEVTDTVTITVTAPEPPNMLPIAVAGDDVTIPSGTNTIINASMSYDPDNRVGVRQGIATWQWFRLSSGGGALQHHKSNNNPQVSTPPITVKPGEANDVKTYWLVVIDQEGAECEKTIRIGNSNQFACDSLTVTTTAPPPLNASTVADAGMDQSVKSGITVELDGSGSTHDSSRTVTYAWAWAAGTVGATEPELSDPTAVKPTFTADTLEAGAEDVEHIYTLTVTDSAGDTDTDTVTITVTSPIKPLVAEAGEPQTADSGTEVTLDGRGSTKDRRAVISWSWVWTSGNTGLRVDLTDADTARPTFTATLAAGAPDAIHTFTLTVTDDQGSAPATDTVTITIEAPDLPPLEARAGADQTVDPGDLVTLKGSGTPFGIRSITYAWTWAAGTEGATEPTLSDPAVLRPTFTAAALEAGAADVIHIYTLTITDNRGSTPATDSVRITVTAPPPTVADAGMDQTVASGATVMLDGRGSTKDPGTEISYLWQRTGGTGGSVTLIKELTAQPTFTADTLMVGAADVTHIFTLTVEDNERITDTDMVTITVVPPLDANAGADRTVDPGDLVTLDGSGSENGSSRTVTHAWTWVAGTEGATEPTLSDPTVLRPTFTAAALEGGAADVIHIYTLTITDNRGSTQATDSVRITVTAPPRMIATTVANAGMDQTVASGATVMLDGSGSTKASSTGITYLWERTGGTGGRVNLISDRTAQPTFTADTLMVGDAEVTHIFTLTVEDDEGNIDTDMVTITVFPHLVANAGDDQSVSSGATVTLRGTGSTVSDSNRTVTYDWERTSGTSTATVMLSDKTMLRPTFTADTLTVGASSVTHVFTLTVTDNKGSTAATDTVTVTVTLDEVPPVADAGADATVNAEGTIPLDGNGSTVDSRRTLTYSWTQTGGTGGTLADENTATPTFTAPTLTAGADDVIHTFTLTVTDSNSATSADTVEITVNAPPLAMVAGAAERTVKSGESVTLDGSGSSDSTGKLTYAWTRTGGTGGSLTDENTATPTFTAPTLTAGADDVIHTFTLTVTDAGATDGVRLMGTTTVTITVTSAFADPVARAVVTGGQTTVASGAVVMLDGSSSTTDRRRTITTHAWTGGTPGATAALTNAGMAMATFTADTLDPGAPDVTHTFTLTVTDSAGEIATATVEITVTAPFAPLVAEAGTGGTVSHEAMVPLVGTGSTVSDSNRTITYAWARTGGTGDSSVAPDNPAALLTSFTAETLNPGATAVTHIFTLTVTDNQGSAAVTDTVTFTVNAPGFTALVAEAGTGGTVDHEAEVPLVGTGSTVSDSNRTITYAWSRTGGTGDSSVAPDNPAALLTSFTAETLNPGATAVTHIFTLTVTDDQSSAAATDTVTFTVNAPGFTALVAEAGTGGTVDHEAEVPLVGTGSTVSDSNRTITYAWSRTGGTGDSSVAPDNPAALLTSFTAETLNPGATAVTHIFTLTVTDDQSSAAATDTVTFTVNAPDFDALVAEAGTGGTVDHEAEVPLVGTGSTVSDSNRTITYAWARTGGTGDSSVTPLAPAALSTSFTAETLNPGATAVTHIFTLTVTDNKGSDAATAMVTFTVNAPDFDDLVAVAGTGGTVSHEAMVPLVGTGSTVSDSNRTITYAWARTGGTGDSSVTPLAPAALVTSFTTETLNPGATAVTHIFTLTVTDNKGSDAATAMVTFTVNAPDFDDLVAVAGTGGTVSHEAMVPLVGTGSTVSDSNRTITYAWARTGGTGDSSVTPLAPAALLTSFTTETLNPGATAVTHIFTLTVTDNKGSDAATAMVTFTVNAPDFDDLVAVAGTGGTVSHEAMVPLVGTGSTVSDSNRTITYAWARTGGTGDSSVTPLAPLRW